MSTATNKPATLKDIANKANVSDVAVGRVLLGSGRSNVRVGKKTEERIRQIAKELNYRPNIFAQHLKGKASKIIGVVVDSDAPDSRFALLSEVERHVSKRNYRLMIGQTRGSLNRLQDYVGDFSMWRAAGMIWMAHDYPGNDMMGEALQDRILSEIPHVVFVDQPRFTRDDASYVHVDRADGVHQAVAHLVAGGRRHIGLIVIDSEARPIQERKQGYLKAHRDHTLEIDSARMGLIDSGEANVGYGDDHESRIASAARDMLGMTKVDAILAQNDVAAVYIIKECLRLGYRVPEDIGVVGFDNLPACVLVTPRITTIDKVPVEQARRTVDLVMNLIEYGTVPVEERQIVLKPKLIIRESA